MDWTGPRRIAALLGCVITVSSILNRLQWRDFVTSIELDSGWFRTVFAPLNERKEIFVAGSGHVTGNYSRDAARKELNLFVCVLGKARTYFNCEKLLRVISQKEP